MQQIKIPAYTIYNDPVFCKFIAEYFGWESHLLVVKDADQEIAQVPFVKVGKQWISVPHGSVCGTGKLMNYFSEEELYAMISLLIESVEAEHDSKEESILQAEELRTALPLMEYKNCKDLQWQVRSFYPVTKNIYRDKVLSLIKPAEDTEKQFSHFSSNLRRKIRKAEKNGIIVKSGREELADDFFAVYTRNCHRLGSPFFKKDFYTGMLSAYPADKAKFFVAYLEDKPVGASLLLGYKKYWENIYFATRPEFNALNPSYLLHWSMIRYAILQQAETYSFGRSSADSGTHIYKKQWGTTDLDLYWNYAHPAGVNIRKYGFLSEIWKRLPYGVSKAIGPGLAKKVF